jgi:hypothetical protein
MKWFAVGLQTRSRSGFALNRRLVQGILKRFQIIDVLAERVGFEPTVRLPVQRFSRPSHSTSLAPLR